MSKKDMIDAVARECELTKEKAGVVVDTVINHIQASMKRGEEVNLPGFGKFKVQQRKERKARNPQTKAEIIIPASRMPKFQPAKALKDSMNN